jgi:Ca-activated chloride channel family protein
VTFASPYLLALLAAIPVVLLLRRRFLRETAAGGYSDVSLLAGYRPTWRVRYRWLPSAVRAGALVLLIVGLARPQVGHAESVLPAEGIDVALVLDISTSMSGSRLGRSESRLEAAQRVLRDFISGRETDQLALVVFREESLMLSPLTLDYDALSALVGEASTVNIPDGTAIGVALADAVNLMRESKARSRAIVLLTDGQNNVETIQPIDSAQIAAALGVRVYTIGVLEASRSTTAGQGVDEASLRKIAELTDGVYFPASSPEALAAIYDSIDGLEKSRVSREQYASYNEIGVYFLIGALGLLSLEVLATSLVWRRAT